MKTTGYVSVLAIVGLFGFIAGSRFNHEPRLAAAAAKKVPVYACPMHPQYTSDRPGTAPCCGMPLELRESAGRGGELAPGAVRLAVEKQQLIGIRLGQVERTAGRHVIRMPGRVAADESRTYVINAAIDGWVRTVTPNTTGSLVTKDEALATFYSREFLSAQQNYFYALNTLERLKNTKFDSPEQVKLANVQVWSNEDTLEGLGMGPMQIEEVAKSRQYVRNVVLRSPANGFILTRNISPGQRLQRGQELYRIAELDHIWVLADVFEHEARYIQPGQRTTVHYQGRSFAGEVSPVLPQFDANSRTLKVRVEVANPDHILRPDMFADVEFPVEMKPALTLPNEAILDSGLRKTVFVARNGGVFEPRAIETGWRLGDRVEVVSGLAAGDRVVTAGNFLLDSESRLQAASADAHGKQVRTDDTPRPADGRKPSESARKATDPVCGMDVDAAKAEKAGRVSTWKDTKYYFCADDCKRRFDKDPKAFFAAGPQKAGAVHH